MKTVVASREHSEKLAREYLDKSPLPEATKKAILAMVELREESAPRPRKADEESQVAAEASVAETEKSADA